MKKNITILIIFLSLQLTGKADLQLSYDFALFERDSNSLLEFYYSYPDISYTMKLQENNTFKGNIKLKLIISENNKIIKELVWEAPYEAEVRKYEYAQDFYGIQKIYLQEGIYSAKIEAEDAFDESNFYKSEFDFVIAQNHSNKLNIGALQIANNIIPKIADSGHSELFYKNQYYVYPNPLREISSDIPTLHLYTEIYNAKKSAAGEMNIKYILSNALNQPVFEYEKKKKDISDALVETISIPLEIYSTGVYYIKIIVSSKDSIQNMARTNKFYLINKNAEIENKAYYTEDEIFEMSEFATYSEEKANREFEMFSIVANKKEINSWEKLTDLKAKQRFLYIFWFTRNPNQTSPFNVELQKFRSRVEYSKTYFSFAGKNNGWKTDRGKIYIRFGEPDQRNRHFASPDKRPYEDWAYSGGIDGGGEFYFVDSFGMGDFKLLHSTADGYIKNDSWYSIVTNVIKKE